MLYLLIYVLPAIVVMVLITFFILSKRSKSQLSNKLLGTLVFSVFGPLIGGLTFEVYLAIGRFLDPFFHHSMMGVAWFLKGIIAIIFFAYVVGIVPAAITGFVAGTYRSKLNSPMMYLSLGFIGATISFVYLMLILGWGIEQISIEINAGRFGQIFSMDILPGFISGTVFGILFGSRRVQSAQHTAPDV